MALVITTEVMKTFLVKVAWFAERCLKDQDAQLSP